MHELIGRQGVDKITGFAGVITGRAEYISGCTQLLLVPRSTPGAALLESHWFDEQRISLGAEAKVSLDNSETPGPDKPAPKQ